jgi:hypothetical protein
VIPKSLTVGLPTDADLAGSAFIVLLASGWHDVLVEKSLLVRANFF